MVSCSICGSKEATVIAVIEGVSLEVCDECAKLGRISKRIKEKTKVVRKVAQVKPEVEETVVLDFAKKIREVREKNKMTQEEFAKALNEKLSVMRHVENGTLVPSLKLARKIEEKFGIKLVEEQGEVSGDIIPHEKVEAATLGDLIEIKRRKK
ncbi:MAG: TIGR00270 family protein [Nanoarchaeota archaeon]|nr:TIGR00270 family protein [Nanoarchaeota archaeon]